MNSLRLRLDLKDCKLGFSLSLLSNFDHICGPKYLREGFPYCTELNLDMLICIAKAVVI